MSSLSFVYSYSCRPFLSNSKCHLAYLCSFLPVFLVLCSDWVQKLTEAKEKVSQSASKTYLTTVAIILTGVVVLTI